MHGRRTWVSALGDAVGLAASLAVGLLVVAVPVGVLGAAPAAASPAAWTITPSPNTATTQDNELLGVSCPDASFCVGVGYYSPDGNVLQTLIETWNGTSWTVTPSPNGIGSTYGDLLFGVSCTSASSCVAVGTDIDLGSALVETWNGSTWSIAATPSTGSYGDLLSGVSCLSSSFCVAVGSSATSTTEQTLVEQWDGATWSVVASPDLGSNGNDLYSVSCTGTSQCVAVGDTNNDTDPETLVESWNGSGWTVVPSPDVSSSTQDNLLSGVSCTSASFCVAVGQVVPSGSSSGTVGQTLVETWNGSSWSITPSPNPAAAGSGLSGVWCNSPSSCVAVGAYPVGTTSPTYQTLVEDWNGSSWSVAPSTNTASAQDNGLSGVACSGATCTAVGSYAGTTNLQTLVETGTAPTPPPACNVSDHVAAAATSPHTVQSTGLGFTPLASPVRIADTRTGAADPATYAGDTLCPGGQLTIDLPSSFVPAGAGAVVVQVTAISPTAPGFVSAFPAGTAWPGTANVNFTTGQTVGNLVTVGVGTDPATSAPAVTIYNGPASGGPDTDVAVDLYGYFAAPSSTSGDAYVPLSPTRIFDTRPGSGDPGSGQTLTNGGTVNVPVSGVGGVPADAAAVVVNIAVTDTDAASFIEGYPTGSPPSSSTPTVNQNWVAGETLSTKAIIGVGSGGSITLANHAGDADVVVDVDGYFTGPGGTGALFNALGSPVRVLDTRPGGVAGGQSTSVQAAGSDGVPSGAVAVVWNVVDVVGAPGDGNFLTVYPFGMTVPTAADVNYVPGDLDLVVDNASFATTGSSGAVGVYNGPANAATANVVVDEYGWFG